jgi:hypothetical protein
VIVASAGGELNVRTVRAIEAPARRIEAIDATTTGSAKERVRSRSSSP